MVWSSMLSRVRPPHHSQRPASLLFTEGGLPPLVHGELPLPSIGEEGVPSRIVVGIPAGIHPMLVCELVVLVVLCDRCTSHRTLWAGGDRHAYGTQLLARGHR
jgi:hypothetical protein